MTYNIKIQEYKSYNGVLILICTNNNLLKLLIKKTICDQLKNGETIVKIDINQTNSYRSIAILLLNHVLL